jgi:hypothetical protein
MVGSVSVFSIDREGAERPDSCLLKLEPGGLNAERTQQGSGLFFVGRVSAAKIQNQPRRTGM